MDTPPSSDVNLTDNMDKKYTTMSSYFDPTLKVVQAVT